MIFDILLMIKRVSNEQPVQWGSSKYLFTSAWGIIPSLGNNLRMEPRAECVTEQKASFSLLTCHKTLGISQLRMPEVLSCLLIYIPAVRRGGVLPVLFSSLVETISVIGLKRRAWQRLACSDHHSAEGRVGLYRVFQSYQSLKTPQTLTPNPFNA